MKILKSLKRVVCGLLDAIKGIVKGDLSVKDAYHFTEGSRAQRKRDKEEAEKQATKKMRQDISDIAEILRNNHKSSSCEDEETF